MRTIAIISDIHGNLEALEAVLEDIASQQISEIYCLGDVIGYGPNPIECLEKVVTHCRVSLMGNHEEAVIGTAFGVHQIAREAINWTRIQIKPRHLGIFGKRKLWAVLQTLPLSYSEEDYIFVHGSPRDPTYEYILPGDIQDLFGGGSKKIIDIFKQIDRACFVGHSHKPGIVSDKELKWNCPQNFDLVWQRNNEEKIICNVGSVGQPRDRDNRACYVSVTQQHIRYHRVSYEIEKTQSKIRNIPSLHNMLADRLARGA